MIDHTDLSTCQRCNGSGWIMDNEDNFYECDDCQNEQDAMRAERDADLDAMHAAREDELVMVAADDAAIIWPF